MKEQTCHAPAPKAIVLPKKVRGTLLPIMLKILEERELKKLSEHGSCFVSGTQNPYSIGIIWYPKKDGSIQAEMFFTEAHQGLLGHVHGGVYVEAPHLFKDTSFTK